LTADDVVDIIDRLAGIDVWVDGGWGVDALVGEQTREHDDLDLVVSWDDLERVRTVLSEFDYRVDPPELPAFYVLVDPTGRRVDLHLVVFDEDGNGWQQLRKDDAWGLYPAQGLRGEGIIGGRRVRCLTPELQLKHHLGYEWDENDRHDLALLSARFGIPLPPGAGSVLAS
jgi:lincosamide nucleotidyltransferase A/C/D/E